MKKLLQIIAIAIIVSTTSCTRENEVIKTVYVTPSGKELPDSLRIFFSSQANVDKYNHTLNDLKSLALNTNSVADYIIVTFGKNKVATNCPDNNLMPSFCITFTCYRNNQIIDFYHYKISKWSCDYINEDLGLKTGTPVWNNTFYNKEFIYDVIPANASNTPRKTVIITYPF